jgi:hypothetical protein
MTSIFSVKSLTSERRRYERVEVSYVAQVHVMDDKGRRLGVLRQLSRGGFMLEPDAEKVSKEGKKHKLILVDRSERVHLPVKVVVRYADIRRAGFEFEGLDLNSAVEIGTLIGKYYQTDTVLA